jgi:hypothetical protein
MNNNPFKNIHEYIQIFGFGGIYTEGSFNALNDNCNEAYKELNIWSLSCDDLLKRNYVDKNRKMDIEKLSKTEWDNLQFLSLYKGETRLNLYKNLYNDKSFALIILVGIMFKNRDVYSLRHINLTKPVINAFVSSLVIYNGFECSLMNLTNLSEKEKNNVFLFKEKYEKNDIVSPPCEKISSDNYDNVYDSTSTAVDADGYVETTCDDNLKVANEIQDMSIDYEEENKNQDIFLICKDCESNFPFTSGEQEFYIKKGFVNPIRCPDCIQKKKELIKKKYNKNK